MSIKYVKRIIFTLTPLKGIYRYKDEFQVYPINISGAPNGEQVKHHPVILEYHYDELQMARIKPFDDGPLNEMMSHTLAQTNKLIQITNLLSSITNFRFFYYRDTEMNWSMPVPDKMTEQEAQAYNNMSSNWSWKIYYYPAYKTDLQINQFSNPDFKPLLLKEHHQYYWYDPVEGQNKSIDLPNTIDQILDKYYELAPSDKKVIDSAIYQFCNGLDLFNTMKSLSFFSMVSSIETLVNHEYRKEKMEFKCNTCKSLKASSRTCPECGEPTWGLTAKFREFLFKYVSNVQGAAAIYNKIYSIRSKIAHTDYLINDEKFMNWDFNDKTEELSTKHLEAKQLARRSLANWLLKKSS